MEDYHLDNFWTWFKKKYSIESLILEGVNIGFGNIPGQMLIGYMIEYLNEKKFSYNLLSLPVDYCYLYLKCLIECYNDLTEKGDN